MILGKLKELALQKSKNAEIRKMATGEGFGFGRSLDFLNMSTHPSLQMLVPLPLSSYLLPYLKSRTFLLLLEKGDQIM